MPTPVVVRVSGDVCLNQDQRKIVCTIEAGFVLDDDIDEPWNHDFSIEYDFCQNIRIYGGNHEDYSNDNEPPNKYNEEGFSYFDRHVTVENLTEIVNNTDRIEVSGVDHSCKIDVIDLADKIKNAMCDEDNWIWTGKVNGRPQMTFVYKNETRAF